MRRSQYLGLVCAALVFSLAACNGHGGGRSNFNAGIYPPVPERKPVVSQPVLAQPSLNQTPSPQTSPVVAGGEEIAIPSGLYRVQPGDTLYAVSRRSGVPISALVAENGLTAPYNLRVDQVLVVPSQNSHVVASGDTLYSISRRYGVPVSELVRLNQVPAPYTIHTGQVLLLPGEAFPTQVVEAVQPNPVPLTTPAPDEVVVSPAPAPASVPAPEPVLATGSAEAGDQAPELVAAIPPVTNSVTPDNHRPISDPPPRSGGRLLWPIQGAILSDFGPKEGGLHNDGININGRRGEDIHAAENGVVTYTGSELRTFGNLILVRHQDGWVTAYAHADQVFVRRGDIVERGQVIARVGTSGGVAEPQLHFEVRQGTRAVDPELMLEPR